MIHEDAFEAPDPQEPDYSDDLTRWADVLGTAFARFIDQVDLPVKIDAWGIDRTPDDRRILSLTIERRNK